MTIPFFDYRGQLAELRDEVLAAVERVLDSGSLILGPEVEAFEKAFAEWLGGGHAVGVGNGTDALAIALRAAGVGPGDEVVTVANSAVPTVSAIRELGATPVFCDVDPGTLLMDVRLVPQLVTARTKAVVPVHLFGNVVDVPALRTAVGPSVRIIEDCAQAHGARLGNARAGTLGDASAFSFYPTKNLGAFGDGGLCFTRSPELADTMRSIRMYGFEGRYYAEREGVNSRLDELQAALLAVKLPHLDGWIEKRRVLAARYDARLGAAVDPVRPAAAAHHAYHLYVVRVADRDGVRSALSEQGVLTGVHYPYPIHLMRAYEFLGCGPGSLPVTEAAAARVLSLPIYPELAPADVDRVCEALNARNG